MSTPSQNLGNGDLGLEGEIGRKGLEDTVEATPGEGLGAEGEIEGGVEGGVEGEKITAERLVCKYCARSDFKNRGQLLNHYRKCPQSPQYLAKVAEKEKKGTGIYKEGPQPNQILKDIVESHPDLPAAYVEELMSWADMSGGLHPMQVSYLLATMKGISKTTGDIVASKYNMALQNAQAEGKVDLSRLGAGFQGMLPQSQSPSPGLFPATYPGQPGVSGGVPPFPVGSSPQIQGIQGGQGVQGIQGGQGTPGGQGIPTASIEDLRRQWEQEHQIKTMAQQIEQLRQQGQPGVSPGPGGRPEDAGYRVEEKQPQEYIEEPIIGPKGRPILDKKGIPYMKKVTRTVFPTAPSASPGEGSMVEMLKLIQESRTAGFEQAKAMYEFASKSGGESPQVAGMGQMEVVEVPVDEKGEIASSDKAVTIMRKTRPLGIQEQVSPMQLMDMMQKTRDTGFTQALEAVKIREAKEPAKPAVDEEKLLSRTREVIREETAPLRQTIDTLTTDKKIGEAIQSAVGPYRQKISDLSTQTGAPTNVQLLRQQQDGLDKIGERTEKAIKTVGGELRETVGMMYGIQGGSSPPAGQYQTSPGQLAEWAKRL